MALKNLLSEKRLKPVDISTAQPTDFENGAIVVSADGVLSTSNGTSAFTIKNHPDLFKPLSGVQAGDIPKGYAYIDSATGKVMESDAATGAIKEHNASWGAFPTIVTNEAGVSANGVAISGHETRLTTAEGTIVTHGTDIGTLQTDVITAQSTADGNTTKVSNIITANELTPAGTFQQSLENTNGGSNAGVSASGDRIFEDTKNNFLQSDVGGTITFDDVVANPPYLRNQTYTITYFFHSGRVALDSVYESVIVDTATSLEFVINRETYYEIVTATTSREADRGLSINLKTTKLSIGLDRDGNYIKPIWTNYLASTTSVSSALTTLDTQVSTNEGIIGSNTTKIGEVETTASNAIASIGGLAADGSWQNFTGTTYLNAASSIKDSIIKLDVRAVSNANGIAQNTLSISQTEATASNLILSFGNMTGPDGTWDGGLTNDLDNSNYLAGSADLTDALMRLDSQISLNDDSRFHGIVSGSVDTTLGLAVFDYSNDRKNAGAKPESYDEILYIVAPSTIQMQEVGFGQNNIQPTAEIYNNTLTDYTLGYSIGGSSTSIKGYLDVEAWSNSVRVNSGSWEDIHVPDAITVGAGQKLTLFTVDKPFGVQSANKVNSSGTPIASNKTIYGYFRIESI